MYTVFDPKETILVDYHQEDEKFIVIDLLTKKTCNLSKSEFRGDVFKYNCDFLNKFLSCFPGKKFVLFTTEAENFCTHLKRVNRDDIF